MILFSFFLFYLFPLKSKAALPTYFDGNGFNEITSGGETRYYTLYVPSKWRGGGAPTGSVPVLVGLHGGGSDAIAYKDYFELVAALEKYDMIGVFPEGNAAFPILKPHEFCGWNSGTYFPILTIGHIGPPELWLKEDVLFLDDMLDLILDVAIPGVTVKFDSTRLFFTGHSNGAMMVYRFATDTKKHEILAMAPVSGTVGGTSAQGDPTPITYFPPDKSNVMYKTNVMHFHGANDINVAVEGGESTAGAPSEDGRIDRSLNWGLTYWLGVNGCNPATKDDTNAVVLSDMNGEYVRTQYSDCYDHRVRTIIIANGDHFYPTMSADLESSSSPKTSFCVGSNNLGELIIHELLDIVDNPCYDTCSGGDFCCEDENLIYDSELMTCTVGVPSLIEYCGEYGCDDVSKSCFQQCDVGAKCTGGDFCCGGKSMSCNSGTLALIEDCSYGCNGGTGYCYGECDNQATCSVEPTFCCSGDLYTCASGVVDGLAQSCGGYGCSSSTSCYEECDAGATCSTIDGDFCCQGNLMSCTSNVVGFKENCSPYGCNDANGLCFEQCDIGASCSPANEEFCCEKKSMSCTAGAVALIENCLFGCNEDNGTCFSECTIGASCSSTPCCYGELFNCSSEVITGKTKSCEFGCGENSCLPQSCVVGTSCTGKESYCCNSDLMECVSDKVALKEECTNDCELGVCVEIEDDDSSSDDDDDDNDDDNDDTKKGNLNAGAIVGITVGAGGAAIFCLLLLVGVCIFCVVVIIVLNKKKKQGKEEDFVEMENVSV